MSTDTTADVWGPLSRPTYREAPAGDMPWKDNAYLGFWDPAAGVRGLFHWSTSPNGDPETIYGQLSVCVDGVYTDIFEPLQPGQDGFSSESMTFELGSAYALDRDDLAIRFETTPRFHVADYSSGGVVPSLDGKPLNHFHQSAHVTGTVTVAGVERPFDGLGWRDRTWGFRHESHHLTEYWAALLCFDDYDLSIFKFPQPDGSIRVDGFVLREHDFDKITDVRIDRDFRGLTAGFRAVAGDTELVVERTSLDSHFHCPMGPQRSSEPTFSVTEEFGAFNVDGTAPGYGLVEHGILRKLN